MKVGLGWQATQVVALLGVGVAVVEPAFSLHPHKASQITPLLALVQPTEFTTDLITARLDAPMAFVNCGYGVQGLRGAPHGIVKILDHIGMQLTVIAFEREHIVSLLFANLLSHRLLATHRIQRHNTAFQTEDL